MDVEAGVPPMTAIQAATINVAKTFHKDKDYGSVEPGKVADLSIIEGDPLQDIWMTQNVKMVVLDGKIVDPQFTGYVNPIPEFNSWQQLSPTIEVSPLIDRAGHRRPRSRSAARASGRSTRCCSTARRWRRSSSAAPSCRPTVPADAVKDVGMYKVTVKSRRDHRRVRAPRRWW